MWGLMCRLGGSGAWIPSHLLASQLDLYDKYACSRGILGESSHSISYFNSGTPR